MARWPLAVLRCARIAPVMDERRLGEQQSQLSHRCSGLVGVPSVAQVLQSERGYGLLWCCLSTRMSIQDESGKTPKSRGPISCKQGPAGGDLGSSFMFHRRDGQIARRAASNVELMMQGLGQRRLQTALAKHTHISHLHREACLTACVNVLAGTDSPNPTLHVK
jgi:hypothetical protein